MRRLFFDIETSYMQGWFWRPSYKTQITYEQVLKDSAIICICYKWQGSDKIHYLQWDKGNDKEMMDKFFKVIEQADEVVAHNGDYFDIKWIRTRFLIHGYSSMPHIKSIDTLQIARTKFNFQSNRLDAISKQIGIGGKLETGGIQLWHDIIQRNSTKAMKLMIDYCKKDVELLEKVYLKLEGFAKPKTHIGINSGGSDKCDCPYCGEHKTHMIKREVSASGEVKPQMRCTQCNKYFYTTLKAYTERLMLKSHKQGVII